MWFVSYESRQRAADFDIMRACTAEALQHPDVISRLGPIAGELATINSCAYLPDIRHGQAQVPKGYNYEDNRVALLPVHDNEAVGVKWLTSAFINTLGPRTRFPDATYSSAHGRKVSAEEVLDDYRQAHRRTPLGRLAGWWRSLHGMRPQALASYRTRMRVEGPPLSYAVSVPIIIARSSLVGMLNGPELAAIIGHEEGHHLTMVREGVVQHTLTGGASTELFAFDCTDALLALSPRPSSHKVLAAEMAALRAQNTTPEHPYAANQTVIRTLVERGILPVKPKQLETIPGQSSNR